MRAADEDGVAKEPQAEDRLAAGAEAVAAETKAAETEARGETADDAEAATSTNVSDENADDSGDDEQEETPENAVAAALAALAKVVQPAVEDEVTISDEAQGDEKPIEAIAPARQEKPKSGKDAAIDKVTAAAKTEVVTPTDLPAVAEEAKAPVESSQTTAAPADVHDEVIQTQAEQIAKPVVESNSVKIEKPAKHEHEAAAAHAEQAKTEEAPVEPVAVKEETSDNSERRERGKSGESKVVAESKSDAPTTVAAAVQQATTPAQEAVAAAVQTATNGASSDTTTKDDAQAVGVTHADGSHDAKGRQTPHFVEAQRAATGNQAAGRARGTGEVGRDGDVSQADRVRFVQRVAKAVQSAVERGGELQIRLSPPELGSLRLQVKLADGALSAKLEAETPQAKQILTDNLPQLRERLAQQDIKIEKFDVDLFSSGGGGGPTNLPDRRGDTSHDSSPRGFGNNGSRRSAGGEGTAPQTQAARSAGSGRLDIVI
ncbi:MAG: flagellar hook-length control protein FliK [Pirellulales bacterium]